MMRRGERAFTVAELLVTVAIIAVLAAMVVPVFEARSEEARSLTCQSNMQRIVTAIRMYMTDHGDTLPPREHRPEVLAYFDTVPGGSSHIREDETGHCRMAQYANPYLRWPVVLDTYLSDRDVWQCPSATIVSGGTWIVPGPNWLGHLQSYEGLWGRNDYAGGGPCYYGWPQGWGGTVTDSVLQRELAISGTPPLYGALADGAFVQSIGTTWWPELTLAEVADASKFIIVADAGVRTQDLGVGVTAYPEICALECGNRACGWVDWEICDDWAAECGVFRMAPNNGSLLRYASLRAPYARHRGRFSAGVPMWERSGVNIGFLNGHVNWIASETFVEEFAAGNVDGVKAWGPTREPDYEACLGPDVPTLY